MDTPASDTFSDDREALAALGRAVRARRTEMGASQEQLAEAAGLHRNYVGGVERGERNLGYINLVRIARALGITVARLTEEAEMAS